MAKDFTKWPGIAFQVFSDLSSILLGMQSLKIKAGFSKECNETGMRLIQGLLNTQKDIVERLSTLEGNNKSGGSDLQYISSSHTRTVV